MLTYATNYVFVFKIPGNVFLLIGEENCESSAKNGFPKNLPEGPPTQTVGRKASFFALV